MTERGAQKKRQTHVHHFIIEGLDCANCAGKIEAKAAQLQGVEESTMQFATKTLRLGTVEPDIQKVRQALQAVVDQIEPGATVQLRNGRQAAAAPGATVCCEDGHCASEQQGHEDAAGHGHDHGHEHAHGQDGQNDRLFFIRMGAGALLYAIGTFAPLHAYVRVVLFLSAYLLVGYDILLSAFRNILRGQVFDENFLMSVASLCAFAIGEYVEGGAVMLFYQIGEWFQGRAVRRSRQNIADLMNIRPDIAHVQRGGGWQDMDPAQVQAGEIILVKPGERVALDGVIMQGSASLDTMALTGESVPRDVGPGSQALSGMVNTNGLLQIQVLRPFAESTASRILEMVENASYRKAKTERFITRFSRIYTPIVVFAALLLAVIPPLLLGQPWGEWIRRACVFLVISCPCALVISIPLGFFGGIGAASSKGILVKGASTLETLLDVRAVAMDKTGTLTHGSFSVGGVYPAGGVEEKELTRLASIAEHHSLHPIAQSIRRAFGDQGEPEKVEEIAGHGIRAVIDGQTVLAGNWEWFRSEGIVCPQVAGTVVHIAKNGRYMGCIAVADRPRPESAEAIAMLRRAGVNRVAMLTGDTGAAAQPVADSVGIDEVYAGLLPGDKVDVVETLMQAQGPKGKLAFIGDGINDAPVLARADVGVAMGALGSDAAIEAADVVLMHDDPRSLATAIRIARRTHRIVTQNIVLALGVKGIVLVLGAVGIANMWLAVFADVGVSLLAVFNAMRVLRMK